MNIVNIINIGIALGFPVIIIVAGYYIIKAAVRNAILEAKKELNPGSEYFKSIIKSAVKDALEESRQGETETQ
ncbi:MAG: DUF6019 family protein [Defluviitaleaceae bacterium]|nr:DUF6019 family protein [Defluviitaleaceae bacterium]MCL2263235.1 DUF6019 family protein [Defluviitaleaceae bacterium]